MSVNYVLLRNKKCVLSVKVIADSNYKRNFYQHSFFYYYNIIRVLFEWLAVDKRFIKRICYNRPCMAERLRNCSLQCIHVDRQWRQRLSEYSRLYTVVILMFMRLAMEGKHSKITKFFVNRAPDGMHLTSVNWAWDNAPRASWREERITDSAEKRQGSSRNRYFGEVTHTAFGRRSL